MSERPASALDHPEQVVADLQRQLAKQQRDERGALLRERDEHLQLITQAVSEGIYRFSRRWETP